MLRNVAVGLPPADLSQTGFCTAKDAGQPVFVLALPSDPPVAYECGVAACHSSLAGGGNVNLNRVQVRGFGGGRQGGFSRGATEVVGGVVLLAGYVAEFEAGEEFGESYGFGAECFELAVLGLPLAVHMVDDQEAV